MGTRDGAPAGNDRAHRALGHLAVVRMNDVRHVGRRAAGRQVRGRAQIDDLVLRRHRLGVEPRTLEHLARLRVEFQAREDLLVPDPAARILVDQLDEFGDGAHPVPHDMTRRAAGRGDEFAGDDEQSVVVALEEGLDDDRA